jgi:hypothetical protein
MKKHSNILMEDYTDFQPRKTKQIKKFKTNQVSFSELEYDDFQPAKKKKNVDFKQY